MNRILVIRGGAIGDFILILPALQLLRDNFPGARLEILGYKHIVSLAENRSYAAATRSIEDAALSSFFSRNGVLAPDLVEYFGGFDLIVTYLFDPDGIFAGNLARAGVRKLITGPGKLRETEHAARQLAHPLAELGLLLQSCAARLYPSDGDRAFAKQFTAAASRPLIALHPGSGSPKKNWPIESWRQLADLLRRAHPRPALLVITGEAEAAQAADLKRTCADRIELWAECLPLPHLAAVIAECSLFIGHDSGVSHIAAAVGTPSLLLFGPTDPAVWAPANELVRIVRSPTGAMKDLKIEQVTETLRAMGPLSEDRRVTS